MDNSAPGVVKVMAVYTVPPKVFVWATAHGSPERKAWMMQNYNQPITEAQYIEFEKSLPHNHPHAANCRGNAKGRYKSLKERYGFFTPEARVQ